jgi:GTP cyclohydrolase I
VATQLLARDERPDAEGAVARLLRAIGEDPEREGLLKTPERVAKALSFLTSGSSKSPLDVLNGAIFSESYQGLLLVRDIEFYSLCEHHLLPFFGKAHIAYRPAGRVIGLSKLPRLVDVYARRLQVQERLTEQVALAVQQAIQPHGVAVRLEAAHFCMMMRGVEKQESLTITSSFLGELDHDMELRQEFFAALRREAAPEAAAHGAGESGRPRAVRVSERPLSGVETRMEPAEPTGSGHVGVFTGTARLVPRGKYPGRVGVRPSHHRSGD